MNIMLRKNDVLVKTENVTNVPPRPGTSLVQNVRFFKIKIKIDVS